MNTLIYKPFRQNEIKILVTEHNKQLLRVRALEKLEKSIDKL